MSPVLPMQLKTCSTLIAAMNFYLHSVTNRSTQPTPNQLKDQWHKTSLTEVCLTTTFINFTQHLVKGHWSPSCLIHRQLHQRGHRESHGRRGYWPPSLSTSTETTAKNKDKFPRKSHIKKLNILYFRSLAILTF